MRAHLAISCVLLSAASIVAQGGQPIRVETFYPRHAAPGQTTVISVAIPSPETVQSAEVSPPAGLTVAGIKGIHSGSEQNIGWWEVTLNVARDAAPGERALVLVLPRARTAPAMIAIATHAPAISNLRITPPASNQPTADLQLAVTDTGGDLGESPYVWFRADCGNEEPIVGALRSKVNAGVVRAALPKPPGKCDVQVRITDSTGIESNTLKTAVEFAK